MKTTVLTIAISFILGLISFNASAQTTYRGYSDNYGNTTVTGSNGHRSTSYTDNYGNTTIRTW